MLKKYRKKKARRMKQHACAYRAGWCLLGGILYLASRVWILYVGGIRNGT